MNRLSSAILLSTLLLVLAPAVLAWDGNWTDAKSAQDYLYSEKDSHSMSGNSERPEKYWKAPTPDFADVDPDELHDYFDRRNKNSAPYALARVTRDIRYNNQAVPKGYYLVKPGGLDAGSPRTNLKTLNDPAALPTTMDQTGSAGPAAQSISAPPSLPAMTAPSDSGMTASTEPDSVSPHLQPIAIPQPNPPQVQTDQEVYRVFVLKRLGKVVAVVPIHTLEAYKPPKGTKVPRQALAWVEETGSGRPVLRFYYKKQLYSTYFQ